IELVYMVATLYLLVGANILLISTPFPTHNIKTNLAPDEFLFDFHIHTTMSDGWISPEQRVDYYLDHGISGAAFTDHDNIRGALLAQKYVQANNLNFTVWVGEEWTDNANDIHMNYFGINEEIVAPLSKTPSGIPLALNASDMIDYIKGKGGYVIVNHYNFDPNPQGGLGIPYSLEQLCEWGVDGFEIVNGDHVEDAGIRNFCLANTNRFNESLICIGGSDIHTSEDLNAFVKLRLDSPSNKSIDNIFRNLRNNTHSVITINLRANVVDFPGELNDLGFDNFERFLNYLLNLNSIQALSWICWSSIFYVIFLLVYKKRKIL
ncbi:MAG: PHP domain-containing protein, partial [Promethearchaeota archaeon]